jgi:hypothetical protein
LYHAPRPYITTGFNIFFYILVLEILLTVLDLKHIENYNNIKNITLWDVRLFLRNVDGVLTDYIELHSRR